MFRCVRSLVVALFVLSGLSPVLAQSNTGFIAGVVKDSSGGVLPGASVKIVNDANAGTDLVAQPDGSYRSEPVAAGTYKVSAALDGFETIERRVTVSANQ